MPKRKLVLEGNKSYVFKKYSKKCSQILISVYLLGINTSVYLPTEFEFTTMNTCAAIRQWGVTKWILASIVAITTLFIFFINNNTFPRTFQIYTNEPIATLPRALNIKKGIHPKDAHFNLLGTSLDTFEIQLPEEYCNEGKAINNKK